MLAGLDVGASFHMLYSPTTGKFHKIKAEDMNKIIDILRQDNLDGVVLEPTGSWSVPLIRYLHKHGVSVYMVHTTRFRRFAASRSNNKDDKKDAYFLAEYGKLYEQGEKGIVLFKVTDAYIGSRDMWKLWKEREALQKLLVAEENRLREQLYQENPSLGRLTRKKMLQMALDNEDELISSRAQLIIDTLHKLKMVESRMKDLVEKLPDMKAMIDRLTTIPQMGFITAYFIAMQVVGVDRFNKRSFRAFVGVGRKKEQSGISKDKTRSSRSHRTFRKLFYTHAMRLIKQPEWERYYAWQLARVSVGKKALWRVISKLVNIIYGVLRNGEYDPKYVYESVSDEQYKLASTILMELIGKKKKRRSKKLKLKDEIKSETKKEYNKSGAG